MTLSNGTYGLTLAGLKIKPFDVIVKEIQDDLSSKLGSIDLGSRSVFSTIINIVAEREALVWQLAQEAYNAMYPDTAEGISLDNVCAINGLARSIATNSYVLAQITAINHTIIPRGSEIRIENTNNILSLHQTTTVSNNFCTSILIQIQDTNSPTYTITIDTREYTCTKDLGDSVLIIVEKLKTALATDSNLSVDIMFDGSFLQITSIDKAISFMCFVSQGISIINCTSSSYFVAKELGVISIPVGSANIIETPVSGWISVTNATAGVLGRDTETDVELRSRREESLRLSGSGTIESMKARLLNINDVIYAEVIDNRTNITAGDLPPKSFKATVVGSTDLEVGLVIWQAQPIGIESVGSTSVVVKDAANKDQVVKFSRPVGVLAFINIMLTVSELFIDESMETIKQAIAQRVKNLKLGESLILQSLYSDIYLAPGIKNAAITMGKASGSLSANDITVDASEIITVDTSNITISQAQ
jgi:uncharacterized phage protein gp47/JayE